MSSRNLVNELQKPISEALEEFSAATDGAVRFGYGAAYLSQRNSEGHLRSHPVPVHYLDQEVGRLTTVLFQSQDGTGDSLSPGTHSQRINGRIFPSPAKITPRDEHAAQAIHGDAHLALVSFQEEQKEQEVPVEFQPYPLAGSLSLFRLYAGGAVHLGHLGLNDSDFAKVTFGERTASPTVTRTINPRRLEPSFSNDSGNHWSRDLRAVYNPYEDIAQVAGFITFDRDDEGGVTPLQAGMLHRLGAIDPVPFRGPPRPIPLLGQ